MSATPHIQIEGFAGPLDALLETARADGVALSRLRLLDALDQILAALRRPEALSEKADWVVIAARIVELRSRLLLPRDSPGPRPADTGAETLRVEPQVTRTLAAWLEARPLLGRDVFARGAPGSVQAVESQAAEIDFVEFLWASVAVFDGFSIDPAPVYQPRPPDLHSISDARIRIPRLLADAPAGLPLAALRPASAPESPDRRRSGWTSTFAAGLELARLGAVALEQADPKSDLVMRLRG